MFALSAVVANEMFCGFAKENTHTKNDGGKCVFALSAVVADEKFFAYFFTKK